MCIYVCVFVVCVHVCYVCEYMCVVCVWYVCMSVYVCERVHLNVYL